jgi:hypothetical protein
VGPSGSLPEPLPGRLSRGGQLMGGTSTIGRRRAGGSQYGSFGGLERCPPVGVGGVHAVGS